jgi:hypothetical protein
MAHLLKYPTAVADSNTNSFFLSGQLKQSSPHIIAFINFADWVFLRNGVKFYDAYPGVTHFVFVTLKN